MVTNIKNNFLQHGRNIISESKIRESSEIRQNTTKLMTDIRRMDSKETLEEKIFNYYKKIFFNENESEKIIELNKLINDYKIAEESNKLIKKYEKTYNDYNKLITKQKKYQRKIKH
jgi:DNA-binding transcriptional regulator GbsR (MarR family)